MKPISPEIMALSEAVTTILAAHGLDGPIDVRLVEFTDGMTEVWLGHGRRLGAIPPESINLRAARIRVTRN